MSNRRARALKAWVEQGLRCHWCKLYIPASARANSFLSITIDHLDPKWKAGGMPARRFVAAHKGCNNARHYNPSIPFDVVRHVYRRLRAQGFEA